MDQQQEQQKKKRPYYNNRRNHGNRPAQGEGNAPANKPGDSPAAQTPDNHSDNRPHPTHRPDGRPNNNRGRSNSTGGDIHTRRGGFRPAPDAAPDEVKPMTEGKEGKAPAENKEIRDGRENRDNRSYNKNRGNKGRGDGRPRDGAPKENRPNSNRPAEQDSREDMMTSRTENESRSRRNENNRDGKGRSRRGDGRANEAPSRREHSTPPRDPEMDAWFAEATPLDTASTPTASHRETGLSAHDVNIHSEPETLPHIELDLNDILPAIVLEKYEDKAQPTVNVEENPEEAPTEPAPTVEVVGVRFNKTGKVYYFSPEGNTTHRGDAVIVETARGLEFGEIWQTNHTVPESEIVPPLRPVVRLADEKDVAHNAENRRREDEAFRICLEKIKAHGLDMKLVEAQYTFDNSKLLFYFTSAGRVDFRELVKDLASVFRTRIELRQIGIRDEAKLMGGLGICGRPLCCASFLSDFSQVSIKMAKEQNLSLNSAKISGTCGRLMCCLNYEYPVYCEASRLIPSVGSTVSTPEGTGTVVETNPLGGTVKVALTNAPAGTVPQFFRREDVRVLNEGRKHAAENNSDENHEELKED